MSSLNNNAVAAFLQGAIEETLDLFSGAAFSLEKPFHGEATITSVSVFVKPNTAETGTARVQVYCYSTGHLAIEWNGLPLLLIDPSTGEERLGFIDDRGSAEFVVRPHSDSDSFTIETLGPTPIMEAPLVDSERLSFVGAFGEHRPLKFDIQSADGRIEAHAEQQAKELRITLTSHDETLNDTTVRVVLKSEHDKSKPPVHKAIRIRQSVGRGRVLISEIPKDAKLLIFLPRVR